MLHRLFPLGLYGTLLAACVGLLFPAAFARVERVVLGVAALPLRTHGLLFPRQVFAAESAENDADLLTGHLEAEMTRDLMQDTGPLRTAGWRPILCRVVGWRRDRSDRRIDSLVLDRSEAELVGSCRWVTYGGTLVGVVAPTTDRSGSARAEVQLLHHPDAPPVAVSVAVPGMAPQRAVASRSSLQDPWPLKLELWADPYLAMRLDAAGLEVRTAHVPGRVDPGPPAGLLVGTTRPWGYQDLSIGMFVAPEPGGSRVGAVVVWTDGASAVNTPEQRELLLGTASRGGGRLVPIAGDVPLVAGGDVGSRRSFAFGLPLPEGGATSPGVVMAGRWWGNLRPLTWGHGIATPVASSADALSVLVLPMVDGEAGPPRVWRMRRVAMEGDRLWLEWLDPDPGERLPAQGIAYSGVQGTGLPVGCVLGACELLPGGDGRMLQVDLAVAPQNALAWLWTGEAPL